VDIAILGASGRVGEILIQEVLESSEDKLVACYVSDNSEYVGRSVDGTDLQYEARSIAGAPGDIEIPISVFREGEIIGQHLFRLDLGSAKIELGFQVDSLASFARGALQAGHWVHGRPPGTYTPADLLAAKLR
jgi:dihydrodipicolinate reductase